MAVKKLFAWTKRAIQPQTVSSIAPQFRNGLLFAYTGATNTLVSAGKYKLQTGTRTASVDRTGKAASFNGTSDAMTITASTASLPKGMTFLYLAKSRNVAAFSSILSKASGGTGFETTLANTFGSPVNRIYSSFFNGTSQVAPTSGFVNGVADSLNGTFATASNVWYAVAGTCSVITQATSNLIVGYVGGGGSAFGPVDVAMVAVWDRILTNAELKALSINPWQIFQQSPAKSSLWLVAASGTISRPNSDIVVSGWTGDPDNANLYANIDESTASDAEYIDSPSLSATATTCTFGLSLALAAGTYDVGIRAQWVSTSGQLRVVLLDSGGTSVGASSYQALSSSATSYTLPVTTTGSATQARIEALL